MFNVNNIQIEKKDKITNMALADLAIKKGFKQLIKKILLKEDVNKLSDLNFSEIKSLVTFYQISNITGEANKRDLVNFSVTFDKDKIHDLFYKKAISYSEISDKELYILPIIIENNEIYIFNNNFFYQNWNEVYDNELIEFILPLENIEIIKNINTNKNDLINLDLSSLFQEYSNKNLALVLIEKNNNFYKKIYFKTKIQGKKISKNLEKSKQKKEITSTENEIIIEIKNELINLVKSKNLIDIRTPSFINVQLELNKKSNLVKLKSRIKNIDLIENVYVQEFNKNNMNLRIKYLGKLDKMINRLNQEDITIKLINNRWVIKTL